MRKIGGKILFAKKMVKNYENSVFRVIFVKKKEEDLLGSGPFSRDGRVTGNKHLFLGIIIILTRWIVRTKKNLYNCYAIFR